MQFTIEKTPFLAALKKAGGLTPKKTTMPILSCVLLDVQDALTISGTDLAVEVQVKTPISIGAIPGRVAVSGSALLSAIDALPDGAQATLEKTEDGRLRILSGRTRFHLPIRQPDEFPAFLDADGSEVRAQAQEWRRAIDRVAYAMSTDEIAKAQLCGMFLHARKEGLRVVATTGNIVSRSDLAVTEPARDFVAAFEKPVTTPGVLIPRESVSVLRRLLDGIQDEAVVAATISGKRAVFEMWPIRFATTLASAEFPPYETIIERQHVYATKQLTIPRAEFLACLRRVRALAGDKNRIVTLTITAEGIRVATTGDAGTDAVDIMEAATGLTSGTLNIGFASGMLMSGIESLNAPKLLCDLAGGNTPTFWRAEQEVDIDAAEHFVLVMPCLISAPAEVA